MNFLEFRRKIEEFPLFETKELPLILEGSFNRAFLNNLANWEKSGNLIKLRKGLYFPSDLKLSLDAMVFASKIYSPSYVSLESALGHYGIIPEAVFTTTSVTTKKTKRFKVLNLGEFQFQKIKREAFEGFETYQKNFISFNLALPEKALVDFFYLNRNKMNGTIEQFREYRFNEEFEYDSKKLADFSKKFNNKKTELLTNKFIEYYAS